MAGNRQVPTAREPDLRREDGAKAGDEGSGPCAVSVILASYNRAYCLHRAIDSVLDQTFRHLELIIVDDGSTDDTKALVESYDDPRIVFLHHQRNRGLTICLNEAIRAARAPLIAIQDSDDEWLSEKLEKQVAVMRAVERTSAWSIATDGGSKGPTGPGRRPRISRPRTD